MTNTTLSIADTQTLVIDILQRHATSAVTARSVAKALVAAEVDGQAGHGLSRVPAYAAQAASGKVDGHALAKIVAQKPAAIRIDAANGFAYPAMELAIHELTKLAKANGVAAAAIYRSHHFGQVGYHAERLAEQGLVGIVLSNSPKAIAPWGGQKPLFGTNPIAFAAPREKDIPLLIDLSLSKVARGKVMLAQQQGKPIPDDWALDANGQATTDPEAALQGSMLPMGDAKGAALVLMVEILAAALTGANFGYQASSFFSADGEPPGIGHTLLAFDPGFFSGGGFAQHLDVLLAEILAQENVRLPGSQRSLLRAKAQQEGLHIPVTLWNELNQLNQ
jgi:(2R)-3-sulfolactate dehydrogenase (NADP+)